MAEGEAIIGKCTENDGGVDNILFKAQQSHIEPLKPHQMSILCKACIKDNFRTYPPLLSFTINYKPCKEFTLLVYHKNEYKYTNRGLACSMTAFLSL